MQWDAGPNAGFTTPEARPWLPLAVDYATRNVAAQASDPVSMLSLFRALTALRRAEPALNRGGIELVDLGVEDVLAYRRTCAGSDGFWILLNLGGARHTIDLAVLDMEEATLVFSTYPGCDVTGVPPILTLAPDAGVILRIVWDD